MNYCETCFIFSEVLFTSTAEVRKFPSFPALNKLSLCVNLL